MNHKQTSLELEGSIDDYSENYSQYMENLKSNNQMITQALKTAQNLIEEYRRENMQLKTKNKILQQHLHDKQQQIEYLKGLMMNQEHQVALEMKVRELVARNIESQQKINYLSQELQNCNKKIRHISKQKQGGFEKNMGNYFKFSRGMNQNLGEDFDSLKKEIRSLTWKLEQREDEINMLLRRNKLLQEKIQKSKTQRNKDKMQYPTCPTEHSKTHYP